MSSRALRNRAGGSPQPTRQLAQRLGPFIRSGCKSRESKRPTEFVNATGQRVCPDVRVASLLGCRLLGEEVAIGVEVAAAVDSSSKPWSKRASKTRT
jgi:hypothetical protein